MIRIWIYNSLVRLYVAAIKTAAAAGHAKAVQWVQGRKKMFEDLNRKIGPDDRIIWYHCASAGELEQAKPLIEAMKEAYPAHKTVISFFSPSGYHAAQKYTQADVITYLPADTRASAKKFINALHPQLAVFVKYEYWYHHLSALSFYHIPVLMVSSIFRKDQVFFKWYGSFFRQLLFLFRQIFVQDEPSRKLLAQHQITHCRVAGDTRFDRVIKIAARFEPIEAVERFARNRKLVVAGSTWPDDEKLLARFASQQDTCFIIAPHEIDDAHIRSILSLFPRSIAFSQWLKEPQHDYQVLVMDNMGMLSRLYHYAQIAYIGGGFNKSGIHNTLEAAVYSKPVIFGPHYSKFREARELIQAGGAFSIANYEELQSLMSGLLNDPELLQKSGAASGRYVKQNTGATMQILQYIQENRLLTR